MIWIFPAFCLVVSPLPYYCNLRTLAEVESVSSLEGGVESLPRANAAAVGVRLVGGWVEKEGGREGGNFTALTTPAPPPPMGPRVSITQWGSKVGAPKRFLCAAR